MNLEKFLFLAIFGLKISSKCQNGYKSSEISLNLHNCEPPSNWEATSILMSQLI